MRLTTSNILSSITDPNAISITTGGSSTDNPLNVIDPDFATFYQSSDTTRLTVEFGATASINYVAVAGINIKGAEDYTSWVAVKNGTTDVLRVHVKRNQPVVLTFTAQTFSNLKVVLYNPNGDANPILNFVAAGNYLEVPNSGEQSGYARGHIPRHYKNRATVNGQAEPTSILRHKVEAKGKLSIPNATRAFSEDEWQAFLEFAEQEFFFIQERPEEIPTGQSYRICPSCYVCYEPVSKAMAHAQTRLLNNLSLDFKVSNGL